MPVHLQPYYRALGFEQGMFPEAEAYGRDSISLPIFYGESAVEQDVVSSVLSNILRG